MVDERIFQRAGNENFIEVNNCPIEPLKASKQEDDEYFYHRVDFKWNFTESLISKFYFSFEDFSAQNLNSPHYQKETKKYLNLGTQILKWLSMQGRIGSGLIKTLVELEVVKFIKILVK